jgi:hypothetical protein
MSSRVGNKSKPGHGMSGSRKAPMKRASDGSSKKRSKRQADDEDDDDDMDADDNAGDDFDESEESGAEDDDDDEEDEDDETSLPRSFYFLAHKLLRSNTSLPTQTLNKAENALNKCRSILLELNPSLNKIYRASKTRASDGKVPPGSNLVIRSLADDRYLLCLCCVELSKIQERKLDYTEAVDELRQAVLWFPKCIQANFRIGFLTKAFASSEQRLEESEKYLKKAVLCLSLLKKASSEELAATVSAFDEEPVKSAAVSASSNSSSCTDNDSEILLNATALMDEELCAGESALEQLTLLYCQQNRFEEGELLMKQQNFTWRLGKQVPLVLAVSDVDHI